MNTRLLFITCAWLIAASAASLLGVDPLKSIVGNFYRKDGLLTLLHLVGFSLVIALNWHKSWRLRLARSIAIGAVLVSLLSMWQALSYYVLGKSESSLWNGAIDVTFGQPNFLAGYLLVSMPLIVYVSSMFTNVVYKKFTWVFIAIIQAALVLTRSWIGTGLSLVWWGIYSYNNSKKYRRIYTTIIAILCTVLVGVYVTGFSGDGSFLAGSRTRIWRNTFLGALKKPVLGYGLSNTDYAFESVVWPLKLQDDVYIDKAHSIFLETFATTGIVGSLLFGYMQYLLIQRVYLKYNHAHSIEKRWHWTMLLTLVLYLAHANTNVISISEELLYWVVLGIYATS